MQTCCTVWVIWICMHCLLCLKHVAATPYDPHVPDHRHTWFEGWYTRIQSDTGLSFAAVTGSFPGDLLPHSTAYAGILYQPHVGHTKAYHAFPSDLVVTGIDGQPVKHQPDQLSEANFALHATDKFVNVSVHGLSLHMSFAAEGALLEVEGYGPLLSWGSKPGDSPEGPAAKLPFLNLHWYVYSLGTPVTWTFHDPQLGPETLSGQGWAHMEKDWGRAFPNKWVWAQGMKLSEQSDKETAPQAVFALAGGPVPVGALWLSKLTSLLPTVWLVGYYSQTLGHWNFRPTDPAVYKVAVDACTGTFELQATSLRKSLVVELQASTDGFVPLHCPTAKGFQIESVESFSGHARVEAYVYQLWPWKERGWKLVEVTEFGNAALEFGGSYRCQQDSGLLDEHHLCTADA